MSRVFPATERVDRINPQQRQKQHTPCGRISAADSSLGPPMPRSILLSALFAAITITPLTTEAQATSRMTSPVRSPATYSGRSTVYAPNDAVATSQPLATTTALGDSRSGWKRNRCRCSGGCRSQRDRAAHDRNGRRHVRDTLGREFWTTGRSRC